MVSVVEANAFNKGNINYTININFCSQLVNQGEFNFLKNITTVTKFTDITKIQGIISNIYTIII